MSQQESFKAKGSVGCRMDGMMNAGKILGHREGFGRVFDRQAINIKRVVIKACAGHRYPFRLRARMDSVPEVDSVPEQSKCGAFPSPLSPEKAAQKSLHFDSQPTPPFWGRGL